MPETNAKTRTKDTSARLEALKAKYINQIYGDFRVIDVLLQPVKNSRQVNNIPVLRLQCTECGAMIERRADRPFKAQCSAGKTDPNYKDCKNLKFNNDIKRYISSLRRTEPDADPAFLQFEAFRSFLLSKGFKKGETIRVRRIDPNAPLSAANAQIWASNSQLKYQDQDGNYVDLRAICRERKINFSTARSRYHSGQLDIDKICPTVEQRLKDKYTGPDAAKLNRPDVRASDVIKFKSGRIVEYQTFARDFRLDPEKLSDLAGIGLSVLCEKYHFSLPVISELTQNGKFMGELAVKLIDDARFAPVPWSETPYGKEWLRCDKRAKMLLKREKEDEDFDPIEWEFDYGEDEECPDWNGIPGSNAWDKNPIWEAAKKRVRYGVKSPRQRKLAAKKAIPVQSEMDDPDDPMFSCSGEYGTMTYALELMRWNEEQEKEDDWD